MDNERGDGSLVLRFQLICAATVDRNLTKSDGAVLSVILKRMTAKQMRSWPSMDRIAEDAEVDRRTVTRSVGRLIEHGYLTREVGKSHTVNVYFPGSLSSSPIVTQAPEFRDTHAPEFGGAGDNTTPDLLSPTPLNSGAALPLELVKALDQELKLKEQSNSELFSGAELVPVDAGKARCKRARSTDRTAAETSAGFNAFWAAYPSKVDRKGAWAVWVKEGLEELADAIAANVQARNDRDTRWRDGYVPHPKKFLKEERWTTEPFIDRRRESAADRAERLGNEAIRRLGEDERGADALIAEMEQSGDSDATWYLRELI